MAQISSLTTKIVLLGTGTPNADPQRSGPALAIIVKNQPYLIDFGPGVVRRAASAFEGGIPELEPMKLDIAFLTHLHSDHTIGYPDLILTPWVLGRVEPLRVYGPKGTQKLTDFINQAYQADINFRLSGLEPANDTGYKVIVHEIENGIIFEDDKLQVTAFPVRHGDWAAYGFCLQTSTSRILISGDTAPNLECLMEFSPCDVLIHEVYSSKGLLNHPDEWQKYHKSMHTSGQELGEIASQIRPKLLILYHQLLWGTTKSALYTEIKETYRGEVIFGNDLDIFEI